MCKALMGKVNTILSDKDYWLDERKEHVLPVAQSMKILLSDKAFTAFSLGKQFSDLIFLAISLTPFPGQADPRQPREKTLCEVLAGYRNVRDTYAQLCNIERDILTPPVISKETDSDESSDGKGDSIVLRHSV